ncbi:hypothetical protein WJX79_004560 [Trebouxia sp. C0005]
MVRTGQHSVINTVDIRSFDRENSWCRVVVATVAVGSDKTAGKIEAYLVNRPGLLQDCKAYFHYFMDKPTQVLCDLALTIFDRHGQLKPHLYGTFGPETNDGRLLYIRKVTLKQQYRCQGVGRSAVGQLLRQLNSTYHERASWGLAVMQHEDCETSWRPEGVVRGLVAAGADVNNSMALHNAVAAEQEACIIFLAGEGADVNGQDHKGSTPLHIAACEGKLVYVQLLISLGASCASKDHMGYTPLDCSGGFLSPRMKHRLIWTASEAVAMVDDSIDDCIPEWPCDLTNNLCMENLWLFEYVPLPLRERVSKSFAIGWHATLDIIAKLLEAKLLPMATAVKATAKLPSQRPTAQCCHPKAARFFLQKGGRVEYALDAILSHSRVEHEVGYISRRQRG